MRYPQAARNAWVDAHVATFEPIRQLATAQNRLWEAQYFKQKPDIAPAEAEVARLEGVVAAALERKRIASDALDVAEDAYYAQENV